VRQLYLRVVLALALAACGSGAKQDGAADSARSTVGAGAEGEHDLKGTAWQLEDLGGRGVIDNSMVTLEFPEAGRVAGRGGCNRYFGSVELDGESIKFGQMGATRMACAEALMDQEGRYLKALESAQRYTLSGDELLLHGPGLDKPLRFTRRTP